MNPKNPDNDEEIPIVSPQRRIIFDMSVSLNAGPSSQPENIRGPVRLFALNVRNPADKIMMISALFSGLADPNFHSLLVQLKAGLDVVRIFTRQNKATETDNHLRRRENQTASDVATDWRRRLEQSGNRLAKYQAMLAKRDI